LVLLLLLLSLLGTVLIGEQYATVGESCPDKTVNLTASMGQRWGYTHSILRLGVTGSRGTTVGKLLPTEEGPV